MNYFSFALLPQTAKMKEILVNGILIAERKDALYHYQLLQLGDFYAETQSHRHRDIVRISKAFRGVSDLDPYLANIDLSGLFNY
jgi:hypothetical protein